ncbi:hypothetical protein DMH04_47070 [Kibdelosporangium aridum]|uniref:Uncharacterized protein n=1 Tax=Kibdelosporangium aridum TaxID=2030 RepID=A0A428YLC0_KIBAR|nr:hypothetical protein [Kibdelosporangium aridum]RSM68647.1 hypothetical protein DMH04_47070 [Kibdelosporangium aridum]
MTEDDLRDRLRAATADLTPHDDLLESLADKHARQHKRARRGLIGGSVAAGAVAAAVLSIAVIAAVLGALFTHTPAAVTVDPATLTEAEILAKAREADAAAQGMIVNFTTEGASWPKSESWALRSERLGRVIQLGVSDMMVTPDRRELIDFHRRTVTTFRGGSNSDVVPSVSASGTGDPGKALRNDTIQVIGVGAEIHLRGKIFEHLQTVDIWLDRDTFLPTRSVQGVLTITYKWLPTTAENRKNLVHEAPRDFTYEDFPPLGSPIPGTPPTK